MKFAFQDKLIGGETYTEIFEFAKEAGFEGVEITQFGKPLNDSLSREIDKAHMKTGILPSAVCGGYNNWIGDFDENKRLSAVKDIGTSLNYISKLGAQGLIAPAAFGIFSRQLPSFHTPRDPKGDEEVLWDSLNRIAEFAEKYQVNFFLEPLNRYEDHMINNVEQAVSLISGIKCKYLKVMGDFFHMAIEEDNICHTIKKYREHLGYYHLADSNRLQPGQGHTDFGLGLQEIRNHEFNGFLSFECQIRGNEKDGLSQSLNLLKKSINKKEAFL